MTTGEVAASRSKNVRQAANSWSERDLDLEAEQGEERRLDPGALRRVGDVLADGRGDPCPRRRLVVRLDQPGPRRGPSRRAPRT